MRTFLFLSYLYYQRGLLRFNYKKVPAWLDAAIDRVECVLGFCEI